MAGGAATSTITGTSGNNSRGSVAVGCTLTASPSGASNLPTCTVNGGLADDIRQRCTGRHSNCDGEHDRQDGDARKAEIGGSFEGGAVLALVVLFGIPARRRSWRTMLGLLVLMIALGSRAACGGGGSSGGGGGGGDAGTTAGQYTFTITGTGAPARLREIPPHSRGSRLRLNPERLNGSSFGKGRSR